MILRNPIVQLKLIEQTRPAPSLPPIIAASAEVILGISGALFGDVLKRASISGTGPAASAQNRSGERSGFRPLFSSPSNQRLVPSFFGNQN